MTRTHKPTKKTFVVWVIYSTTYYGQAGDEVGISNKDQCVCQSCGPNNNGQCVGPNICCGDFGCYMGTREAVICEKEYKSVQPCERRGQSCGTRGQGVCAADGICCDDDDCSLNSMCLFNTEAGEGLIHLLSQLLRNEDLEKE